MVLTYFRQAWQMMKQQRLFSAIYIGGTALAIATTTIFAIMYYVKIVPIYPEYNRSSTYYIDRGEMSKEDGSSAQSSISYEFARDHVLTLRGAETVTLYIDASWDDYYISDSQGHSDIKVANKPTDPAFFKVFDYDFIDGAPFTQADLDNKSHVAVITDALAEKAFGTAEGAVGKNITLNFIDYKVRGVVRAASPLTPASFADIFTPYTTYPGYDEYWCPNLGSFHTLVVSDNGESLRQQIQEIERRYNTSQDEYKLELYSQPKDHLTQTFNYFMNGDYSHIGLFRDLLTVLLVLLLVPALNLSGMISSRMEMRSSELGVRKSFGATRGALLGQVLWENLLLTLIGGLFGLVLSWIIIGATSGSILTLVNDWNEDLAGEVTVNFDMFLSPWIFLISLGLCVLLNLLSAFIPAAISLRRPIVTSLKEK